MDVVVTVPRNFWWIGAPEKRGLAAWIAEGDAAGDQESGQVYFFSLGRGRPSIEPGERVYVVCQGMVRGYAPLVGILHNSSDPQCKLLRRGGAVAVTIPQAVKGFQGFRYRWWDRKDEIPFRDWKNPNAAIPTTECTEDAEVANG